MSESVAGEITSRPLANRHYFSETPGFENTDPDGRHMWRVIGSMSDEVRGILMERHRGNSRQLAMVITKLDEAQQWAIAYGETVGTTSVIDRREILGGQPSS